MRITLEHLTYEEPGKVTAELSDEATFDEVVEKIKGLFIVYGFHPDTVGEYIHDSE